MGMARWSGAREEGTTQVPPPCPTRVTHAPSRVKKPFPSEFSHRHTASSRDCPPLLSRPPPPKKRRARVPPLGAHRQRKAGIGDCSGIDCGRPEGGGAWRRLRLPLYQLARVSPFRLCFGRGRRKSGQTRAFLWAQANSLPSASLAYATFWRQERSS